LLEEVVTKLKGNDCLEQIFKHPIKIKSKNIVCQNKRKYILLILAADSDDGNRLATFILGGWKFFKSSGSLVIILKDSCQKFRL